jgi:Acetyltransferase (GNAT) domain
MRQGIGRELVTALEKLAIGKGSRKITVTAATTTSPFYEAQGYQILGSFPYGLDNGETVPCNFLSKTLQPSKKAILSKRYFHLFLLSIVAIALWNRLSPHIHKSHQPATDQSPPQPSTPKNKKGRIA